MAKLHAKVKRFIVINLACMDTPTQVADAVKEEFGIVVSRQQVHNYDTTRTYGKDLSKDLRKLFDEMRAKFLAEIDKIPIANQAFRLRAIQRAFTRAEAAKNQVLALQALKQAAEESGGAYTNTRKLVGSKTEPLVHEHRRSIEDYTDAELAELAAGASSATANPE